MKSKTNGLVSEEMNTRTIDEIKELKRSCTDCHTTRTPLWRGGPNGPRSLCNACGIRYRKKRRSLLSLDKGEVKNCKKKSIRSNNSKLGIALKLGLMALGRDMGQWRKLNEEEQAAMLLMALSLPRTIQRK